MGVSCSALDRYAYPNRRGPAPLPGLGKFLEEDKKTRRPRCTRPYWERYSVGAPKLPSLVEPAKRVVDPVVLRLDKATNRVPPDVREVSTQTTGSIARADDQLPEVKLKGAELVQPGTLVLQTPGKVPDDAAQVDGQRALVQPHYKACPDYKDKSLCECGWCRISKA